MKTKKTEKTQSIVIDPIAAAARNAWQAYLDTAKEREAVTDADSAPPNLNVGDCVVIALAVAKRLPEHRSSLCLMPGFREQSVDKLEIYALAAQCAHGLSDATAEAPATLTDVAAKGTFVRARFATTARSLAGWGLFPAESLERMHNGTSYQDVGEDLIAYGSWFRANWSVIKDKCAATEADIEQALAIGEQILSLIGLRSAPLVTDAGRERRRAFAVLVSAYDEVRRGLAWVRWEEGDADEIAPSFHSHERARKTPSRVTDLRSQDGLAGGKTPVATPVVVPIVAMPVAPLEGTTDKPVPVSNPFTR